MPNYDLNYSKVEVNFVTETNPCAENKQADNLPDQVQIQLVDQDEFIRKFKRTFPFSKHNPAQLWHSLLGNHSSGHINGINPHVHFLTTQSCEKIFQHLDLFIPSGIDFQHPSIGFYLTKNPSGGGICDVYHYSEYYEKFHPNVGPLSIILSDKSQDEAPYFDANFDANKQKWYKFLQSKRKSFCTEKELQNAFIAFINTIENPDKGKLNLKFYPPNFNAEFFKEDFNPITLIGRWETIMTNRHLKKADRQIQWKALLQLPLTKSTEAIRVITDYNNDVRPGGFILPSMQPNEKNFNIPPTYFTLNDLQGFRDVAEFKQIDSDQKFWRYIAFQPQRNSIQFYLNAIDAIHAIDFGDYACDKWKMYQMLAACTTRDNHTPNPQAENKETIIWKNLCTLLHTVETINLTMSSLSAMQPGAIRTDIIHHLERLKEQPNIPFLSSIANHITDYVTNTWGLILNGGTGPLVVLSDKLNYLITYHGLNFYKGATFYFTNGKWNTLNVKEYTELQYSLSNLTNHPSHFKLSNLITPHLSTFNIKTEQDLNLIYTCKSRITHDEIVTSCLNYFNDVQDNSTFTPDTLKSIIDHFDEHFFPQSINNQTSLLNCIHDLEKNFSSYFKYGYFEEKRQNILNAATGLTPVQMDKIRKLPLSPEQVEAIIEIESGLVRKNPLTTNANLNELNDKFCNLKHIIMDSDFTLFTQRLASLHEHYPHPNTLKQLLTILSQIKTLEGFNQIFIRNKIEKCQDDHLMDKMIYFIGTIKSIIEQFKLTDGSDLTINRLMLQETLAMITLNTKYGSIDLKEYAHNLPEFIEQLNATITAHPHIQHYLMESFNYLSDKNTDQFIQHVQQFSKTIIEMSHILQSGDSILAQENMLIFFSLLANYHKKPCELIHLFNQIRSLSTIDKQQFLLKFISRLIDNNQSIDGLEALIQLFIEKPETYEIFSSQCQTPPYPNIATLTHWLHDNQLNESYQKFTLNPFGKRRADFQFSIKKYHQQKIHFEGLADKHLFSDDLGQKLNAQLEQNRAKLIPALTIQLNELKQQAQNRTLNKQEILSLLCIHIELLARTTAQLDDSIPPRLISQELNTTQVMALYAMLSNPGNKLISELDTGEGKSRAMMILAACQAAQGKTVDFLTSDMQLAERDYLSYKQFFSAATIRTSLISLSTPKQLYQKGGVNFSDNAQLLLKRNKSDVLRDKYAFLDEQADKRCLLVDEVDKFKHDKSKDSYNVADRSKKLAGFTWIYPCLVRFVQNQLENNANTTFDPQSLVTSFLHYVNSHDLDGIHNAMLAELNQTNPKQISTWINSAYIALHMQADRHYKLTDDDEKKLYTVRDSDGFIRHTRKILVVDTGRPIENSSYSDGVQQCLCAKENILAGREDFIIESENSVQRSSYPISFMTHYDKGSIFGVSGTTRSDAPRANPLINYERYDYLRVPREKKLIREDKPIWLAKDQKQQIEFIKRTIIEKLKNGQPTLLICKDDIQSAAIYKAMNQDAHFKTLIKTLTRVHGLTPKEDEISAIKQAGQPGFVTLSTAGMFARGVDINSANLFVCAAYIPTAEDEIQIKGRTARAGKPGEFRMILDMCDPDCSINGNTYNVTNEVSQLQKKMALNAVYHEEVCKLYALFSEEIHQRFFNEFDTCAPEKHLDLLSNWQVFLERMQKAWDVNRTQLLNAVASENHKQFTNLFNNFTQEWSNLVPTQSENQINRPLFDKAKIENVYKCLISQKSFFKPERQTIKVQRDYDPSDDGQARIYSTLFARFRATLRGERRWFADYHAWREGRGHLFPDFAAVLNGERPLFANLIETIKRWIAEFKTWWAQENNNKVLEEQSRLVLTH